MNSIWRNPLFQVFGGGAVLVILCLLGLVIYLPESSFTLSRESRLPRWFALPPGVSRSDLSVTMDYHIYPIVGSTATFRLVDVKRRKTIARANGKLSGSDPIVLTHRPAGSPKGYPSYEIVTVRGITEVVEHRLMEPIFYITDDPGVLAELGIDTGRSLRQ
jgi:hypothetical protein